MSQSREFSLANKKAATTAFDFIDRIRCTTTAEELKAAFAVEANALGFQHFLFGQVQPTRPDLFESTILTAWPEGWYQHYGERKYAARDPVVHQILINILPFTWQDLLERGAVPDTDRCIFDEAQEWQMHHGFCIPVRSLDGLQAAVSLAGLAPDMSDGAKGALHLMAIYAEAKALELTGHSQRHLRSARRLTLRERECTIWIAAGKSTWDIGQILGLSEQTVASYIKNAMHKLNVVTRAQLVADALRLGEIAM